MEKFQLRDKIIGYSTNREATAETSERYLVDGSQNVLIDPNFGKFSSRGGYSYLGALNTALTPVRQAFTWNNSIGGELPIRWYDDELEVYLGTVGGQAINAWTRVASSLSTTATPRATLWWDTGEDLDLLLWVQNDDNIYEWGGGVFTVASVTSNTITKNGTNTFGQDRAYSTGDKILVCVRTGTEFTYTGGESTTTLTSVTPDPTASDLIAGDILTQKIVTKSNTPLADRKNNYIFTHENQIYVGSDTNNEVYISKNTDYTAFTFSSPRISGEGALLVLDAPVKGFGSLSKIPVIFAGKSDIYTVEFNEITVSTTLAETLKVRKLKTGVNQGVYNQETIVPLGNALIYLTNEPALRALETVDTADQPQLRSLSNPIKPDFDDEDFTNAFGIWHKNRYYLTAPNNSKLYILDYVETADGGLTRFWQPPQIYPIRCLSVISGVLYGHSSAVPETYLLFNGTSDGVYDGMAVADKIPINAKAVMAYRTYGKRDALKNHDEFYVEGNISPSTDNLILTLRYDFGGFTQETLFTINGTNPDILLESLEATSLGQQPLGTQPLGGSVQTPPELGRFRVIFEMPKEDYNELQEIYESDGVDQAWEIIAGGGAVKFSNRRNTTNRL